MLEKLIFSLDKTSKVSLQMQIRQIFVESILNRTLLPGDKLPSSRALSTQLSVCLLYTSPSPRDLSTSRMPSSA